MERILLIEDKIEISEILSNSLRNAGYSCTQAFSGTEGIFFAERDPFSLVILDLDLPGFNTEQLIHRIRRVQDIPIISISTTFSSRNQVRLLPAGTVGRMESHDVKKLFDEVKVQIRRLASNKEAKPQTYRYRDLVLDTESYRAFVKGREIPLTKQEFMILELLVSHPDRVFTKREIYDYAWEDLYNGEEKTINVHISNIRKKLKEVTNFEYIRTAWGTGFQLGK